MCVVQAPDFVSGNRQRTDHKHLSQVPIALLADPAQPFLATTGVLPRHKADPGCQIAARAEGVRVWDCRNQRTREQWPNARNAHQPTTYLRSPCTGHDPAIGLKDLTAHQPELISQHRQACACSLRYSLIGFMADNLD
jgi:hypothetical protein